MNILVVLGIILVLCLVLAAAIIYLVVFRKNGKPFTYSRTTSGNTVTMFFTINRDLDYFDFSDSSAKDNASFVRASIRAGTKLEFSYDISSSEGVARVVYDEGKGQITENL